jgi:single-stranded-DNA-specific exonuclease
MEHGLHAVNLLKETNMARAEFFAAEIEKYNTDRRNLDQIIAEEALLQIQENKEEKGFTSVVYKETWHKGVIGIVASRLIETYYRPTLVFTKSGDKLAASARSIKGFDVYEALEGCSDTIEQFGGHMYAAGLTLLEENYEAFKSKFEEVVANTMDPNLMSPEITIDAIIGLDQITPKLMRIIKQFAPFGPGNMTPVFMSENLKDSGYAKVVGQEGKHLKCKLFDKKNGSKRSAIDAIGFNLGKYLPTISDHTISAVFTLDENEWQGNITLQMKLRDIKEPDSYQI